MSRALLIGGFGSTPEMLEPLGEAITKHFEEVDVLTLREAETDPDGSRRAARGANVVALSAAIGLTADMKPDELHGLDAAIPTRKMALLYRIAQKQRQMKRECPEEASAFTRQAIREITGHPIFHAREYFRASSMDALGIADHHQRHGRSATLAYFISARVFRLRERDIRWADLNNLNILHLPGQHDEPILHPQHSIDEYMLAYGNSSGGRERT